MSRFQRTPRSIKRERERDREWTREIERKLRYQLLRNQLLFSESTSADIEADYAENDLIPYSIQEEGHHQLLRRQTESDNARDSARENVAPDPEARALLPSILVGAHRHASHVYINSTTTGKPSLAPQYPVALLAERRTSRSFPFACLPSLVSRRSLSPGDLLHVAPVACTCVKARTIVSQGTP